jgi:hypothetical protein
MNNVTTVIQRPIISSLDGITFEFSTEKFLLNQYYELREKCYRNDLMLPNFSGEPDIYDTTGNIFIARKDDVVIGGARMNISSPNERIILPLEEDGFIMQQLFPELHLENKSYFETSRFVVDYLYRSHNLVCSKITASVAKKAIQNGCEYQFSISPVLSARNTKKICNNLGMKHEILTDIKVPIKPIYSGLNRLGIYLSITYLTEFAKRRAA